MSRVALLSDIHGNLPALEAVLADCAGRGIDAYVVLGDTVGDFPWPNEVVELVRGMKNATVILGNRDRTLLDLTEAEIDGTGTDTQYSCRYWNRRELTASSLGYLAGLATGYSRELPGGSLFCSHSLNDFLGWGQTDLLKGVVFARRSCLGESVRRDAVLAYAGEVARGYRTDNLAAGWYAFGHTHCQWHAFARDDVLLINPGACGCPTDLRPGAAYSILDVDGGGCRVEERLVRYDIGRVADDVRNSPLHAAAGTWCEVMLRLLSSGIDCPYYFLKYAACIAGDLGQDDITDEVWKYAGRTWFSGA